MYNPNQRKIPVQLFFPGQGPGPSFMGGSGGFGAAAAQQAAAAAQQAQFQAQQQYQGLLPTLASVASTGLKSYLDIAPNAEAINALAKS